MSAALPFGIKQCPREIQQQALDYARAAVEADRKAKAITDEQIAEAMRLFDAYGRKYFEDVPAAKKLRREFEAFLKGLRK